MALRYRGFLTAACTNVLQIYISRVPPFMKPEKLKHLLGQYGDINRIYLVPEDKTHHKKRVANGGNRKQSYTEGWIEFLDKKVAKQIAKMLNTKQIGGRKRDYYHDDIWNLKYLKGFKWDHLTEKIGEALFLYALRCV